MSRCVVDAVRPLERTLNRALLARHLLARARLGARRFYMACRSLVHRASFARQALPLGPLQRDCLRLPCRVASTTAHLPTTCMGLSDARADAVPCGPDLGILPFSLRRTWKGRGEGAEGRGEPPTADKSYSKRRTKLYHVCNCSKVIHRTMMVLYTVYSRI